MGRVLKGVRHMKNLDKVLGTAVIWAGVTAFLYVCHIANVLDSIGAGLAFIATVILTGCIWEEPKNMDHTGSNV